MLRTMATCAALSLLGGLLHVNAADAASLSYVMERSDRLEGGPAYLQVTVADGADGAIDFTVESLPALLERGGRSPEIRAFAFNVAPGLAVRPTNVAGLPDGWSARGSARLDGFGRFDLAILRSGPERDTTLHFSIVGVDGDSPESYALASSDVPAGDAALFAARVRDLIGPVDCDPERKCTPLSIPTAFVATSAVPVRAAAWLGLTAVAAAAGFTRRRRPGR